MDLVVWKAETFFAATSWAFLFEMDLVVWKAWKEALEAGVYTPEFEMDLVVWKVQ